MRTIQIPDQLSAQDRVFLHYKMALLPKSWLSSAAGVSVMLLLNLSNPSHVYNFTPASDYALAAMLLFISNKAAMMLDHLHYYPSRGLRSLPMSP
jgi:hypothetical protein